MSGIFGLFNQDGAPVRGDELARMASLLERRGPDRTGTWHEGAIGLGHTLLATTPELVFERQPLRHAESGCVISADVRLDNRPELLASLGIAAERGPSVGDAEIILTAYLAWGESCVERLLGDFAFAIWDPRRRALFCARDHFGMRPLYYHHTPGRFFAFASEPRAILVLPQTPYRINEGRIADFLVSQLEGIDKTSTFFEEVYRLPPAHVLTVTPGGVKQRRYWTLEPGPELRLPTDEAYAEAFLDVFTESVRCRLRGGRAGGFHAERWHGFRLGGRRGAGVAGGGGARSAAHLLGHLPRSERMHRNPHNPSGLDAGRPQSLHDPSWAIGVLDADARSADLEPGRAI
jgi:asparagine synthase (glutamine-hydrolysing)